MLEITCGGEERLFQHVILTARFIEKRTIGRGITITANVLWKTIPILKWSLHCLVA